MVPKNNKSSRPNKRYRYVAFFGLALVVPGLVLPLSLFISRIGNFSLSLNELEVPKTLNVNNYIKKPLALEQFCDKYETVGRNFEPDNDKTSVAAEITFKSTDYPDTLTLTAAPFPNIHERAQKAKVPVVMYHDILPKKEVFFDVTPKELEADFELIKSEGLTPISLHQLITHLRTGNPLPEKPILLTFDDGYGGHYEYVYPLLQKYNYPAVFSVYTKNMGIDTGRSHVTWEQLKIMSKSPLVTISSHSKTHPQDLTKMSDEELQEEIVESKNILERELGESIDYFTYPAGKHNDRVKELVKEARYVAALAMDDNKEIFAGESKDLFAIGRFGQSSLEEIVKQASGGPSLPKCGFDFQATIHKEKVRIGRTPLILISGGKPETIHADTRYQVPDIIKNTGAVAAVDGGFFSLKYLNSNVMIGPVLSQRGEGFIPGNPGEIPKLTGRPLVLINNKMAKFVFFNSEKHNTLEGIQSELNSVNDAFVAAAWLVKNGEPQPRETFGDLYGFDAIRFRAFWGINQNGQPTIGVSAKPIDSVRLGKVLAEAGLQEAVMLDSGASTSLAYKGESLVGYKPRPVPHVVALFPANTPIESSETDENLSKQEDNGKQKAGNR
ncbi:polysaccharide deacetylase family protein [Mastigocoleus testarum]|uniref:Polysaccharide deacetylase n=1 Tax=Mastigocoleus testarum BC008 TaxID=371196 RepID=A0A0V7ZEC1_9CYAN|nr:polysaccharide deacetylase family protein [Mastigocoleus testarum]KST62830.1 polysaccharide deacetylase [Mastigocoleus testarum BC008]KST62882.1 polysaccharide deacetylase [Mastigocoleus testarum BC008]